MTQRPTMAGGQITVARLLYRDRFCPVYANVRPCTTDVERGGNRRAGG